MFCGSLLRYFLCCFLESCAVCKKKGELDGSCFWGFVKVCYSPLGEYPQLVVMKIVSN